jgi:hypothetical protein
LVKEYFKSIGVAVTALDAYWRAAIQKAIKRRSHREPTNAQVAAVLSSLDPNEMAKPLFEQIQSLERRERKPYSAWTTEERRRGWLFVADMLDGVRISAFERAIGKPKRKLPGRGLIIDEMLKGEEEEKKRIKQSIRDLKQVLPRRVHAYKLGAYAARHGMKIDEAGPQRLKRVEDFVGDHPDRNQDVRGAASDAEAVREILDAYGLDPRLERALRQHLSRFKKK